jgi:ElaB/YqjD/DUF883 family membrane-anchored ribosome-binding protein
MLRFSVVSLIKFVIGILLLQGATGLLVYTAFKTDLDQTWPLFVALGGTLGVLVALWFNSIADSARHQSLAKAKEVFSKEREKMRVRAEQDKAKEVKSTRQAAARAQRIAGLPISPKTGIAIGGAVGLGVAMLVAQVIGLGFLTLAAAGGAMLGYGVRVRQERYAGNLLGADSGTTGRLLGAGERREVKVLDAELAVPAIEGRRRKPKPGRDSPEPV